MIQADRKTISSWSKDDFKQIEGDFKLIQKTTASWSKGRLQADQKDDYKRIKKTITSGSKGQLQADQRDNYKQMSKPWRAETEAIHNRKL